MNAITLTLCFIITETPRYSCDGPKQTERPQEELLLVSEHNSNILADAAEELSLAQIKLVRSSCYSYLCGHSESVNFELRIVSVIKDKHENI